MKINSNQKYKKRKTQKNYKNKNNKNNKNNKHNNNKIKKNKKMKNIHIHNNKTRHLKTIKKFLDDLIMPKHISRYAYYSATFFLLNSLLAFYFKYYISCILLAIVYTTTLLHWSEVKKVSTIKIIDIVFVFLTIANWTLFDLKRIHPLERNIWYTTLIIMCIAFTLNEILFYYQVLKHSDKYVENGVPYKKWHYFTFEYTNPNTKSRNLSYYRSAFTHLFIVHILSQVVVAYCVISSYLQS